MMTALKEYAEPYNWVVDQLKDWAYMVSSIPLHHLHPNSRISRKRIHTFPAPEGQVIRLFCCHRKWHAR